MGDSTFILESNGKPMPQIVEAAHFTAETAAKNIIADIDGGERHTFKPNYHGFMVSLGGAVTAWPTRGGMKTRGFFAMAMKHMINCWYLLNIAGVNQVWEYVKHEFLEIQNKRSFIGGFVAHRVRSYWPLLLRMWLGFMWVVEGVNKISEGWLNFSQGSKSGWMFSPGVIQKGIADVASAASGAVEAAAEAVTAASGAVEAAAETVTAASGAMEAAAEAVTAASGAAGAAATEAVTSRGPLARRDEAHHRPEFRRRDLVPPYLMDGSSRT